MRKAAIDGQLDELQSIVYWVIGIAFVAIVLGIQGKPEIGVLELVLSRRAAYFVLGMVYVVLSFAVLGHVRRVGLLFSQVPADQIVDHVDHVSQHRWLLNPFAQYRGGNPSKWPAALGFTGLVSCFWVCHSSLFVLAPRKFLGSPLVTLLSGTAPARDRWIEVGVSMLYMLPFGVSTCLCYLALVEIHRIFPTAQRSVSGDDLTASEQLATRAADMESAADLGISIGGVVLVLTFVIANWPWS
jgi:hypothetical protein